MSDSPQGQYPQLPTYSQGQVPPGSMAKPERPEAMRRAVSLMYVGAAVGFVTGIVDSLALHNVMFYTYSSTSNSTTVHQANSLVAGIITGIIYAALWLWMAWKTGAGRNWARVLSSVFFGIACLQLIASFVALGSSSHDAGLALIVVLVEWGVGLTAIIQLWKVDNREFFAFTKLAGAYGAMPPGYQPPGYGQPPQYGQPGSDQPSPRDQDTQP